MHDTASRNRRATQRRWGQNFLVNPGAADRILAAFAPGPDDRVLEIGPGSGALTRGLTGRVRRVVAVEIDPQLAEALGRQLAPHVETGTLSILAADILEIDLQAVLRQLAGATPGGVRVLANLPYNIATAVILRLLEHRLHVQDMMMMVQREVADRIVSLPGRKTYGALSVLCQTRARVETILRLGPGSFRPVPKVESAVIRLTILPASPGEDFASLSLLLRAAFRHRRKTLLNNLADLPVARGGGAAELLRRAGIEPRTRAEEIPPQGFVDLLGFCGPIRSR